MGLYENIMAELERRHCDTRFFTEEFLSNYIVARHCARKTLPSDLYEVDGIWYNRHYFKVYVSAFYRENSCSYCEFLEIYNELKRDEDNE